MHTGLLALQGLPTHAIYMYVLRVYICMCVCVYVCMCVQVNSCGVVSVSPDFNARELPYRIETASRGTCTYCRYTLLLYRATYIIL